MDNHRTTRREFVQSGAAAVAAASGISAIPQGTRAADVPREVRNTRSYHPEMEYRRLGKTNLWVSAVCLGGHWKRINGVIKAAGAISPYNSPGNQNDMGVFLKNRHEVVNRCIEVGINCIDLAGDSEAEVYCKVLQGRHDKMYLAYSHPASELRAPANRNARRLLELFQAGLKRCKLECADIWRLMALERGERHSQADVDAMIEALATARQKGLCRFTGLSTHDRRWAKMLIETYPDVVQVVVTPYTAKTKELPQDSMFDAVRKHDVGVLGIKPFSSNALFKGDSTPGNPHAEEDDRLARMVVRYILRNPAITAPIPGLISTAQVDNMVKAVKQRRELDLTEQAELEKAGDEMWARLPEEYQWLREWEYV